MFETITKHVRENSVVRFLLSHLIILLAALLICAVGFRRAFVIVRSDVLNSTKFAMTQAVSSVDNGLTELRTLGMQTARSESIYRLENLRHTDDNYYQNIICAINEYYQRMLYYSPNWVNNTFIYLNSMDRVIYSRAVYTPEVFSNHLREWGDDSALWQEVCTDDNRAPFFCKLGGQDIYYGIPSSRLMSGKTGTVFFRIDSDWLKEKFSFLEQYNGYSLFVLDDDNGGVCLYSHDDLNLADSLPEDWLTAQGTWNSGNDLVLHLAGSDSLGLSYLLVLPEQQAMQRLNALLIQMVLLLFAAVVLGTAVSLYFSVRRGRPVNEIARALQAADGAVNTDLNLISGAVTRLVQDNTYLLQEQAADRPALQTAFYHNLLKSNFVSRPEMEYMANRAGIELTEKTYCAAVLRLFPGIDADAIDGQTVEDARVLQQAISAYVDELCVRPVHNYKRNTLETLYIFEIENQERLLDVLRRVTAGLHEQYHVEAHWGVGTPCDDLMQFWKSAEEASAARRDADGGTAVQVYSDRLSARGYYFPYAVEERLTQSLRAGDGQAVEDVLSLLQTENFVRRSLSRSQMQRLNRRIVEILSAQTGAVVEENADLMALNELAFDYKGDCESYFEALNTLCQALCSEATQQKSARRSENVKAIEEYIRKNYRNPSLGLAMVSAEFNLSEGYLSAIFKKETGTNFAEYLEQLRVKAACVLLEDGCKVSDLPERVGYNSIQSFRRAFKRVMGVSPSEYRE